MCIWAYVGLWYQDFSLFSFALFILYLDLVFWWFLFLCCLIIGFLFGIRIHWMRVGNRLNWADAACVVLVSSFNCVCLFLYQLHWFVGLFEILACQLHFMRKHFFDWLLMLFCMLIWGQIIFGVEVIILISCIVSIVGSLSLLSINVEACLRICQTQRLIYLFWCIGIRKVPICSHVLCFLTMLAKRAVPHGLYLVWRIMASFACYC